MTEQTGWGRFAGTTVPEPEFPGDDGSAAPALTEVLARYTAGTASAYDVVAVLSGARLLVPVVAVLDSDEPGPDQSSADGRRQEKDSHMATVTLVNPDGRRGLLAFSSVQTMQDWAHDARPVAAGAQRVAAAAVQEGADAVLIDVAGPVRFPLEGPGLDAVATGATWWPPHQDPQVSAAVGQAVAGLGPGPSYRISPGPGLPTGDTQADAPLTTGPHAPLTTGPQADAPAATGLEAGVPPVDLLVEVEGVTDPESAGRLLAAALAADPVLARRCPAGIALRIT